MSDVYTKMTLQEVLAKLDTTPYTYAEVVRTVPRTLKGLERRTEAERLVHEKNAQLLEANALAEEKMRKWLARGDGIAVYECQNFDSARLGHKQFVSFGSELAQIPGQAPTRMPDIGMTINHTYVLIGVCQDAPASQNTEVPNA